MPYEPLNDSLNGTVIVRPAICNIDDADLISAFCIDATCEPWFRTHQNEELLFGLAAVAVADDVGLLEPAQNLDFFQSGLHSSRGEAQTCLSKVGQTLLTHGSLT